MVQEGLAACRCDCRIVCVLVLPFVIHLGLLESVVNLSMVIEAVRTAKVAAFVPEPAVSGFPMDQFAVVDLEGIDRLGRRLSLIYEPTASSMRPIVRILGTRLAQICARS